MVCVPHSYAPSSTPHAILMMMGESHRITHTGELVPHEETETGACVFRHDDNDEKYALIWRRIIQTGEDTPLPLQHPSFPQRRPDEALITDHEVE